MDRRVMMGVAALVATTWSAPAWAASGSGSLIALFGVALLAGILTCFSQVIFMMVAVSAPERPPSVWMRIFAVANVLIGAFVVFYFVTTMDAMKSSSEYFIAALGVGGVVFGGFGLWWRRGQVTE